MSISDPVSGVRQAFSIEGDSLVVENWLDPGGKLPPPYHPQQEERWSVVDGEAQFRHGDRERHPTRGRGDRRRAR